MTRHRGQPSPYLYVSERTFPHETRRAAEDVVMSWNERHSCGAWAIIGGRRSADGLISVGLESLPGDEAMAELRGELEPLLGPVVFWGMQWDLATGKGRDLLDVEKV